MHLFARIYIVVVSILSVCLVCDSSNVAKLWEIAVHVAVAGDVYDGVFLCCPFSHDMSWMSSCT